MDKDLNMGMIFYDKVKKKPEEKKAFDLETFMDETSFKKLLFLALKILIIPLIVAIILSIMLEGGFLTIFVVMLIAIIAYHILTFLKARADLRI